jgi:hypothetical protein
MKSIIQDTNYLINLLNESISEKKSFKRFDTVSNRAVSLNEKAIISLLKSKVFTVNEQKALKVLFAKTKTKTLSESTIKMLDKNVRVISSSNYMDIRLREGFFSDIWDGLKSLGSKAKDAIVGGWSKVKAIWGEFKALVQEVINSAKNGLQKLCGQATSSSGTAADQMVAKVKGSLPKFKKDPDFAKEMKQFGETAKWWKDSWYQKWVGAPFWEKDVLAGNGTVDDEPKVDSKAAEQGLQQVAQLESLIRKRNSLLSDYNIVNELLKRNTRRKNLSEGGSVEHLDDAIKNPALKKIVHYAIELIQWVFIPFAKLGQTIASWAGPKVFSGLSTVTKAVGGPGTYPFQLIGTLFGEAIEIGIKLASNQMAVVNVINALFPAMAIATGTVEAIHYALLCYTLANIFINIFDKVEAEKTESYSPNGKFKIQDGNLLYLKK